MFVNLLEDEEEEGCVVKANMHVGLVTTANPNAADNAANIYLAMMILDIIIRYIKAYNL